MSTLYACKRCRLLRARTDFHKDASRPDGRSARCKSCVSEQTAAWATKNRRRKNKTDREWKRRNPQKDRARGVVRRALERGVLIKARYCACCGGSPGHGPRCMGVGRAGAETCGCEVALEAHHVDYRKPLDVRWLCKGCHAAHHEWGRRRSA